MANEDSRARSLLGAIIAGGRSTRFGSDKAAALVDGLAMLDHVVAGLAPHVDAIVLCGRDWPGLVSIADRPAPALGPLGGLCAALFRARARGHSHVLTAPVDVLPFPPDIAPLFGGDRPRVFRDQYLIGLWPADLAPQLERHLAGGACSVRSWLTASGAAFVDEPPGLRNINYRTDLDGR